MKKNPVGLLKPHLNKAIANVFEITEKDVMDMNKRNHLPRQVALYILKEKYQCRDYHILSDYYAGAATTKRACKMVTKLAKDDADIARRISLVEASLLTESMSDPELQAALAPEAEGSPKSPTAKADRTSKLAKKSKVPSPIVVERLRRVISSADKLSDAGTLAATSALCSRSRISPAALLVKVMASTSEG